MELFNAISIILSLVTSGASITLACIAIWLSRIFFVLSNNNLNQTNAALTDIERNVGLWAVIFDKFHSDTFSLLKDQLLSKQILKEGHGKIDIEVEAKRAEELKSLPDKLSAEALASFTGGSTAPDHSVLDTILKAVITKTIEETNRISTQTKVETIQEYVVRAIETRQKQGRRITVDSIIHRALKDKVELTNVVDALYQLRKDRTISFPGEKIHNGTVEIVLLKGSS